MNLSPEFFDIFGAIGFIFIISLSYYGLTNNGIVPRWAFVTLLIIGIIGLMVDGAVVYFSYIKS